MADKVPYCACWQREAAFVEEIYRQTFFFAALWKPLPSGKNFLMPWHPYGGNANTDK
jgi:hypothetical protein